MIAVLAGLGVGGIAVALAAQKTVENFIGGITLYADQPVRVGEFCRFGETVGTVEDVGSARRGCARSIAPLSPFRTPEFSNFQIENFARHDCIWYHPTLNVHYETTPDQIRYILVEARRMLYAHPKVDSASARIRFVGFGRSSLDLEVFSYVTVTDYGEYLEVAEDLHLRLMDIVGGGGLEPGLPRTDDVCRAGPQARSQRAQAAEAQVQEWRQRGELWLPRLPRKDRRDREHAGIPGGRIGPGHGVQTVMSARLTVAGLLALALVLSGCLGPVSLHEAVLGYDDTVSRLGHEMLLVNIGRLRHGLPVHFTLATSIAATFEYQTNAAILGPSPTWG